MIVRCVYAVLLTTAAAAGCSAAAPEAAESPGSFKDARAIASALNNGGLECRGFTVADPVWKEEARCASVEGDVTIRIFRNDDEAETDREVILSLHETESARGLYGDGWALIIGSESGFIEKAQEILGGEIVEPAGADQ